MVIESLLEGFLLGVSTGTICLATCSPIYLPFLISEKRSFQHNIMKVMEISVGRFISYISFGAIAGLIGKSITDVDRTFFTSIAYLLCSVFLVLLAFKTQKSHKGCPIPLYLKWTSNAVILGIMTGINFCPSFLIALTKAIHLGGYLEGMLLFGGFFAGTTLFLIPLAFGGFLASIKRMKLIAQIASIAVAIVFTYQAGSQLKDWYKHKNRTVLDFMSPSTTIELLVSTQNESNYSALVDSLQSLKKDRFVYVVSDTLMSEEIVKDKSLILFLDSSVQADSALLRSIDLVVINRPDAKKITGFIRKFSFEKDQHKKLRWSFK